MNKSPDQPTHFVGFEFAGQRYLDFSGDLSVYALLCLLDRVPERGALRGRTVGRKDFRAINAALARKVENQPGAFIDNAHTGPVGRRRCRAAALVSANGLGVEVVNRHRCAVVGLLFPPQAAHTLRSNV